MPREIFFAASAFAPKLGAKMEQTLSDFAPFDRITNHSSLIRNDIYGRGKRIRTSGPCVPNAVLYQAELFPDSTLTAMHLQGFKVFRVTPLLLVAP